MEDGGGWGFWKLGRGRGCSGGAVRDVGLTDRMKGGGKGGLDTRCWINMMMIWRALDLYNEDIIPVMASFLHYLSSPASVHLIPALLYMPACPPAYATSSPVPGA